MSDRAKMVEKTVMVMDALREFAPDYPRHARVAVGDSGLFLRFPEPFNPRTTRNSASIKPDLHNQVRRFSSGMTLVDGGRMMLPAKWGSGRG